MSKGSHESHGVSWPKCQFVYHRGYGAEQCPRDAVLVITGLVDEDRALACSEHAYDMIVHVGTIFRDEVDEDGPVLVRKLKEPPQPGRDG